MIDHMASSRLDITGAPPPSSVERQLLGLLERFKPALDGLFTVNNAAYRVFEGGWYISLFAHPVKRLSKALSTDRELLILLTNFADQQPRVIEMARQTILSEAGRLEPIAVVVHGDRHGDTKLKNWGREQGLTVLPIYLAGAVAISPADIERHLAYELFSRDPFDVVSPVVDDTHFFGRRDEAMDLARTIESSRIRSCFGIRKIGKTSFLSRVLKLVQDAKSGLCVFVDCSRDSIAQMSSEQLLLSLAVAVEQAALAASHYSLPRPINQEVPIENAAEALTAALQKSAISVVIAFDELDYITPASPTSPHWASHFIPFWRALRTVYQESVRQGKPLSIIVSGVSSKWFSVEAIDGVENAALHFVPEEYLEPFARQASVSMVRRIGKSAGLLFDDDAAAALAEACGDFPFWMRKAASFIHRRVEIGSRPAEVPLRAVSVLTQQFIETEGSALAEVAFAHLCRVYPELKPALVACLNEVGSKENPAILSTLVRYGLVDPRKGHRIAGALPEAGLRAYLEKHVSEGTTTARHGAPEEKSSNEQWAEELAAINKRRNLLERRLRTLVPALMMAEQIANPQKPKPRDRVLGGLQEKRRVELSARGLEQILDKLYWLELCQIVLSQWSAFEKLFLDKGQFQQNSQIINERPDTHAKAMSLADVALMTRALDWMESKCSFE
jgi:hypothetical protein